MSRAVLICLVDEHQDWVKKFAEIHEIIDERSGFLKIKFLLYSFLPFFEEICLQSNQDIAAVSETFDFIGDFTVKLVFVGLVKFLKIDLIRNIYDFGLRSLLNFPNI